MQIVHVISTLDPRDGGPPSVVAQLAVEEARLGHGLTILSAFAQAPAARPAATNPDSVRLVGVDRLCLNLSVFPLPMSPAVFARVTQVLDRADVVHLHGIWQPFLLTVIRYCRKKTIPLCLTLHNMLTPPSMSQKPVKKWLAFKLVWKNALESVELVRCLTEYERDALQACGVRARTVVVVPNGVDTETPNVSQSESAVPDFLPAGASRRFILYLGRLHWAKGLEILCAAFARIATAMPELDLVIAGPDSGFAGSLRRQVADLALEKRVHLIGPVIGAAKSALLKAALCLVHPSRNEGLSMTILEALASGLPVVISSECHMPEVETAGAGMVVPLEPERVAQAIVAVVRDEEARTAAGRRARELVRETFASERVASRLVASYPVRSRAAAAGGLGDLSYEPRRG